MPDRQTGHPHHEHIKHPSCLMGSCPLKFCALRPLRLEAREFQHESFKTVKWVGLAKTVYIHRI